MKTVRMVQPAEQEMLDVAAYYEVQVSSGLGQDFLAKIASALARYRRESRTLAYDPAERQTSSCTAVSRMDCSYRVDPDEVVVLAVAHLHRHPSLGRKIHAPPNQQVQATPYSAPDLCRSIDGE